MKISLSFNSYFKQSINKFLLNKGFSDNNTYYLIKNKNVLIDNKIVIDKNVLLPFKKCKVEVTLNDEESTLPINNNKIDIVYEDQYFLVVNKPINLDVEPTKANYENNLACMVNNYFINNNIKSKIHLVNRLDKLTSGLVIIAKNQYIHNLFSKIKINKYYETLVEGITKNKGTIKVKIAKEEGSVKRIVDEKGKLSITKYKRIKVIGNNSLLKIKLITGRTHQIRLSMSYINHPLVNDPLYGNIVNENDMYLKANILVFKHPITNKKIKIII